MQQSSYKKNFLSWLSTLFKLLNSNTEGTSEPQLPVIFWENWITYKRDWQHEKSCQSSCFLVKIGQTAIKSVQSVFSTERLFIIFCCGVYLPLYLHGEKEKQLNQHVPRTYFISTKLNIKNYYCPLNHDLLAHVYAQRKFGLTLARESALLVIFAASKPNR